MPYAVLPDRAILFVSGEDAAGFLQNLVTSDIEVLPEGEARPSALLTPQGKILFDFLVSRAENGAFRLDAARTARADIKKRLTLYRLRAKVSFEENEVPVAAFWDLSGAPPRGALPDARFPANDVFRVYGAVSQGLPAATADPAAFAAKRIAAGVAEAERDFPAGDVFPHDVLLDWNAGVSFRKGCFVGQEVVSRMQHRGTARRRLMLADAEGHLTPGAEIVAGGKPLGPVIAAQGARGMALVRIDRLAAALGASETTAADGVPLTLSVPPWAGYRLPEPGAAVAAPE